MKKKTNKMEVVTDIDKMIERLRNSKAKADEAEARQGELDGLTWAMRTADVKDLQALEDVADGFRDPDQLGDEPGLELAEELAEALNRLFGAEMKRDDVVMDMFPVLGAGNSPHYVVGFVASAAGVWKEVQPQVLA